MPIFDKFVFLLGLIFVMSLLSEASLCSNAQDIRRAQTQDKLPYIMSLNGEWDFCYHRDLGANKLPVMPDPQDFTAKMPVPGYWDDNIHKLKESKFWKNARFNPWYRPSIYQTGERPPDPSLHYLYGVGHYLKHIKVPMEWKGKLVTLHIGGFRLDAWVWVNGKLVGHFYGGQSVPFDVDLSEYLNFGAQNDLMISIANCHNRRAGCDERGWHGRSAGIHRPVYLKVSGKARISDLYVFPVDNGNGLKWQVKVDGANKLKRGILEWLARDPDSNRVMGSGAIDIDDENVEISTNTFGMKRWSEYSPKLYDLVVIIKDGDDLQDSCVQSFGLRVIRRDGVKILVNDKPTMLRGLCCPHYFPETCTAPMDIEYYRNRIRKFQELGFNWIRFHTWVPSKEFIQAADELGMMLQVEPPVWFKKDEWINILKSCRKHPSVVIYCCGNEELIDEAKIDVLRDLAESCKQLVPDALFNPMEALRGIEYSSEPSNFGDDLVNEPFPHNPKRLALIKEFSDVFGQYAWGELSYFSVYGNWKHLDSLQEIYERPLLTHELGITGNYLNLELRSRFVGTRIGTRMFDQLKKNLEKFGLLERAPIYYRNSCAWMALVRKHATEMARKCKNIAGYDLLGAYDKLALYGLSVWDYERVYGIKTRRNS